MKTLKFGSYFYPFTTSCIERNTRAKELGYGIPDELILCQNATPLFDGHNQPIKYCLSNNMDYWDDSDPKTMRIQVDMAKKNGLDFFIFDTYMGCVGTKFIKELALPLDNAFLSLEEKTFEFATMLCLGRPRVALPAPKIRGFEEVGRFYDISRETVESVVDYSFRNYWTKGNYLKINNKPYVSFINQGFGTKAEERQSSLDFFVSQLRSYALKKYNTELYLVGVFYTIETAKELEKAGVDAITGYGFLANIFGERKDIQNYNELVEERITDWSTIKSAVKLPLVPPAVIGWDTSPRGEPNCKLSEVSGIYPYTPIVVGATPKKFEYMLKKSIDFVVKNVPPNEKYVVVSAWNEICECCCLLPQIDNHGKVDNSYLNILKNVKRKLPNYLLELNSNEKG